jgi:membrane protease YdiL (CAAX protease family)
MNFWERRPLKVNLVGALLLLPCIVPVLASWIEWERIAAYMLLLAATLLIARFYDHMPPSWVGLGLHGWTGRELGFGAMLGTIMVVIAWGIVASTGTVRPGETDNLLDFTYWSFIILVNAAGEELLFRGYLFQRGIEIFGTVTATLLASAIFALAHLLNPSITIIAVVNIFLAGIFFSLCYLRTGSLWLPMAAHAIWNLLLAQVLGVTVSGMTFGESLLVVSDVRGPEWLTGGAFGPEGGIAATIALVAGTIGLLKIPAITYSPYVHAEVFRAVYRSQKS